MNSEFTLKANLVDINGRKTTATQIKVSNGCIQSIEEIFEVVDTYILPGFIDAHVHIESSLLTPSSFARLAVMHGSVATVSDPHEIANVLGVAGVEYMLDNAAQVSFKFFFGAPSCVPATQFETAGAELNSDEVSTLLQNERIYYLSEMMNYPGVINHDAEVYKKINASHSAGKPIDGHAPGLRGADLEKYLKAGISTDHECFTLEEALEKLALGMKILIREGSAARNFQALHPLLEKHANNLMFCSDDKHPDSLLLGHINDLVVRAISLGYNLYDVLQVACINPVEHYKLPIGLLKTGDSADFIVVKNLEDFEVLQTYIGGDCVFNHGTSRISHTVSTIINNFRTEPIQESEIKHEPKSIQEVIECLEGQLVTDCLLVPKEQLKPSNDYLKLVLVNRYFKARPAVAYIKNFGLKKGAIASTVAHDCHNIIAVGVSDQEITKAINLVIAEKGGLVACDKDESKTLALPIAGLMSDMDAFEVADLYKKLDDYTKTDLGSELNAPFMSLSFMALLVIPHLKLSDKGLFSGDTFSFVN
jgi:adenine deaminase